VGRPIVTNGKFDAACYQFTLGNFVYAYTECGCVEVLECYTDNVSAHTALLDNCRHN